MNYEYLTLTINNLNDFVQERDKDKTKIEQLKYNKILNEQFKCVRENNRLLYNIVNADKNIKTVDDVFNYLGKQGYKLTVYASFFYVFMREVEPAPEPEAPATETATETDKE